LQGHLFWQGTAQCPSGLAVRVLSFALLQGNETEGRPLLQRALAIQTAVLGPHHPDVAAIRDVLEEEG
jgi:hypothetical protein